MTFIAKSPLVATGLESVPSIPKDGMMGLFPSKNGWYDINSEGKFRKLLTSEDLSDNYIELTWDDIDKLQDTTPTTYKITNHYTTDDGEEYNTISILFTTYHNEVSQDRDVHMHTQHWFDSFLGNIASRYKVYDTKSGETFDTAIWGEWEYYVKDYELNSAVENLQNKITDIKNDLSTVYQYKGSVDTYTDLPYIDGEKKQESIGEVYNVKQTSSSLRKFTGTFIVEELLMNGELYYNKTFVINNVADLVAEYEDLANSVDIQPTYDKELTEAPNKGIVVLHEGRLVELYDSESWMMSYEENQIIYTSTSLNTPDENFELINSNEFYIDGILSSEPTVRAGDNVAWTGVEWDVLGGTIDLSICEQKANKTTELTSSSTDEEYPSAKAVYDLIIPELAMANTAHELTYDLNERWYKNIPRMQDDVSLLKTTIELKSDKVVFVDNGNSTGAVLDLAVSYNTVYYADILNGLTVNVPDGAYNNDYATAMNFTAGESIVIVYPESGVIQWIGADCTTSDGYSLFIPTPGKRYNIIITFDGKYLVGKVAGFVPASSNKVNEVTE